jgi:hypothetical protein
MRPDEVPSGRDHLDARDRRLLAACDALVAHDPVAAHDLLETLWAEAIDAHRILYQGLANAVAAVLAQAGGQRAGAAQIARRTHEMLAPFPRWAAGFDLDCALASMDAVLAGSRRSLIWAQPTER